jgi:hypothetical protein
MPMTPTPPAVPASGLTRLLHPAAAVLERVRRTPRGFLLGTLGGGLAYLLTMRLATGANRGEQFIFCGLMWGLAIWSDGTRRFFLGLLPFLLFGVVYDLMHITEPLVRYLHVHVEEPYRFDQRFFSISAGGKSLTPNEFFAIHHWPVADFFTGLSYIVFVYWAIGFAAYLALFRRDEEGRRLLRRFGWTFLCLNLAGFVTYYIYPAAPPWYVADHGFVVDFATRSSAAGATRWDALTGIPYFAGFYGRSADVFGAIPSLHVSYPLLTYLFGRELKRRWFNVATFGLFLLVSFAAVYLNHHYVLDVLLGVLYTLTAWGVERLLRRRSAARAPA